MGTIIYTYKGKEIPVILQYSIETPGWERKKNTRGLASDSFRDTEKTVGLTIR